MKNCPPALQAHLAQGQTTLAYLWLVKRTDGTIFGFTTHDQNIVYDAKDGNGTVTYVAATGFLNTANAGKSDLSVDNMEVTAFLESDYITDSDLRAGLYDDATIYVRVVNWADLTMGDMVMRAGTLGNIQMIGGMFHAEIRGLNYKLTTTLCDLYGPICRAELGSGSADSRTTVWNSPTVVNAQGNGCLPLSTTLPVPGTAFTRHYAIVFTETYDITSVTVSDNLGSTYTPIATVSAPNFHGLKTITLYRSNVILTSQTLTITLNGTIGGGTPSNAYAWLGAVDTILFDPAPIGSATIAQDPVTGTMSLGCNTTLTGTDSGLVIALGEFDLGGKGKTLGQVAQVGSSLLPGFSSVMLDSEWHQFIASYQVVDATQPYQLVYWSPVNTSNTSQPSVGASYGLGILVVFKVSETFVAPAAVQGSQYLCHVDLAMWTQDGTVSSAPDAQTIVPNSGLTMVGSTTPSAPAPAGWFDDGVITFSSGVNVDRSFEIKSWDGTTLKLNLPLQLAPDPGDTFSITPGCDHTIGPTGCQKFNNVPNFRGEPFMPNMDSILSYPDA